MALAQAVFEEYWPCWQRHFSPAIRLRLGGVPLSSLADLAGGTGSPRPGVGCDYLSPDELAQWTGLRQEKRRREWLGGRLAAKWAADGFLAGTAVDWQRLVIRSEADGRPYVATEAHAVAPFISISHSGPLAAALAANIPCGLDLQEPGAKLHRVRQRFAAPGEEDLLKASLPRAFPETERLTLLWAAKEAVRKLVRVSPLLGLLEIRLLTGQAGQGTPAEPLALTLASARTQDAGPADIAALCFFADNLAWALAFPSIITKE